MTSSSTPTGPTLADIGLRKALKGGRHRLMQTQYAAAVRELGGYRGSRSPR